MIAGWSLAALTLLLLGTIPFSIAGDVMSRPLVVIPMEIAELWTGAVAVAFVVSGGALIQARPRNPIGWLLLVCGCSSAATWRSVPTAFAR